MSKDQLDSELNLIKSDYQVFLNFFKAKYPIFHKSNLFFRDVQFCVQRYLEKKGIYVSNAEAAEIAEGLKNFFEQEGIFQKINDNVWRLEYPEFVTAVPGDPL